MKGRPHMDLLTKTSQKDGIARCDAQKRDGLQCQHFAEGLYYPDRLATPLRIGSEPYFCYRHRRTPKEPPAHPNSFYARNVKPIPQTQTIDEQLAHIDQVKGSFDFDGLELRITKSRYRIDATLHVMETAASFNRHYRIADTPADYPIDAYFSQDMPTDMLIGEVVRRLVDGLAERIAFYEQKRGIPRRENDGIGMDASPERNER